MICATWLKTTVATTPANMKALMDRFHSTLNGSHSNFLISTNHIHSGCSNRDAPRPEDKHVNEPPVHNYPNNSYFHIGEHSCAVCSDGCRPHKRKGYCHSILLKNKDDSIQELIQILHHKTLGDLIQKELESFCENNINCTEVEAASKNCTHHQRPPKNPKWLLFIDITLLLSLLSLLFTIFVHLALPELRNLHGKNISCFSFSLMISQLFMFHDFGVKDRKLCLGIGVMLHYLWLVVFAWTSILAFDIARTFKAATILRIRRDQRHARRFGIYCLLGWGIPLVLVSVSYFVTNKLFGSDSKYGKSSGCFMEFDLALYALGIPFAFSVIFNCSCFGLTIYGIESQRKKGTLSISCTRKSDRFQCFIYAKLSIICGLAWILLFLFHFFGDGFKEVAALLLNFQGILLFLCTVLFNRRAIGAVKRRMSAEKGKTQNGNVEITTIS